MDMQRWPLGKYLGAWAALSVVQVGALISGAPVLVIAVIAVLAQLAKVPITCFRMADIGRDPYDAIFLTLVPIANFVGFGFCTERTPSADVHAARVARWHAKLGSVAALIAGLRLMEKTALVGVPVSVGYGLVSAAGLLAAFRVVADLSSYAPERLAQVGTGFGALSVFLGIYTLVQYSKRTSASRFSWFPSLLLAPAICWWVLLTNYAQLRGQLGLLVILLAIMSWSLLWMSVGGAFLSIATVRAAHQAAHDEPVNAGGCLREAASRTLEVAGPVGGKVHAVQLGTQAAVLPGLFFALVFAFVEIVAVVEPNAASFKRSSALSWGRRSRLFRIYVLRAIVTMFFAFKLSRVVDGAQIAQAALFDPSAASALVIVVSEVIWAVSAWWLLMTFYVLYRERLAEIAAARAASV